MYCDKENKYVLNGKRHSRRQTCILYFKALTLICIYGMINIEDDIEHKLCLLPCNIAGF